MEENPSDVIQEEKKTNNTKKTSIKKNYLYNLFYQVFLLIIPLITTPYVSRILLAEGVGKYSFSFSLITYFTIVAALGFGYYAQREVAKHQGDKNRQTIVFWEIVLCRLIPVFVSLATNIILCAFKVYGNYTSLMWILSILIVNVAFDIAFFFQGNEQFKSIVIRNFIIKALAVGSIFLFVKTKDDLWVYALINSLSTLLSTLSMWVPLRKLIVKIKINELKPLRHLKGTIILFLPTIAISVYTILDKTLIGLLITDTYTEIDSTGIEVVKKYSDLENGYYEQSEKIVKMAMTIITAIGIVMIPRNSHEFSVGNVEKVKDNIYKTSKFVLFIGIPMTLGLIMSADLLVPWFLGDGYEKCSILLKVLSPLILIIGLSNVFGLQYLIPSGQDKKFTIALLIGAATNIVLNIIFIRFWWSTGAAIATIVAEFSVTFTMVLMIRKDISILKILLSGWKYYISGVVMGFSLYFIAKNFDPTFWYTVLIVVIGAIIYFVLLAILKEELLMGILKKVLKKIRKN